MDTTPTKNLKDIGFVAVKHSQIPMIDANHVDLTQEEQE